MHDTMQLRPADRKISLAQQTQQLRRNLQTPIPAPRIALERKISLRFPHFQGFLTEYCGNVSITGMFIQSTEPRSPGEILDFELDLIDGLQLIQGTGEVVWARRADEGSDKPAGMGIRFLRLGAESRRLIRWAVDKQISAGGEPFDLEAYRSEAEAASKSEPPDEPMDRQAEARPRLPPIQAAAGAAVVDARQRHPYAGYATAKHTGWQARWVAAAAVALPIVILAAALLFSMPRRPAVALANGSTEQAEATDMAPTPNMTPEPAPEASGTETTAAAAPDAASPDDALVDTTLAWARAWANQRPEDYLSHYSRRFQPPRSMSREAWETERTERLKKPGFIQVDVSDLEIMRLGPDRARVTFDQAYRSDNYRDAMRKTLDLVHEDGSWKILDEQAAG